MYLRVRVGSRVEGGQGSPQGIRPNGTGRAAYTSPGETGPSQSAGKTFSRISCEHLELDIVGSHLKILC